MPELQGLAVGDTVPTDPSGGFEVKVLDAGKAMVLYVDTAMIAARSTTAGEAAEATPAGLAASGKFLETAVPPEFAVSWTFVLHPERDGGTRLIERMRLLAGRGTGATKALAPVLGFGVFVMMQRQMVGIRERAERNPVPPVIAPADAPADASGQALAPA